MSDTYQGEGIQAIPISTKYFDGDLLLYNNEICDRHKVENGVGGITLVDVTKPRRWKKLVEGYGDFTVKGKSQRKANESHSAFMWEDNKGTSTDNDDKAYVVMIDNEETEDIDILDITNPSRPVKISETDLVEETGQEHPAQPGFDLQPRHGREEDRRPLVPAGLLLGRRLRDPERGQPGEPDLPAGHHYPSVDPFATSLTPAAPGAQPEGNGHQAEFTKGNGLFIATDEDFGPYRVVGEDHRGGAQRPRVPGDQRRRHAADRQRHVTGG